MFVVGCELLNTTTHDTQHTTPHPTHKTQDTSAQIVGVGCELLYTTGQRLGVGRRQPVYKFQEWVAGRPCTDVRSGLRDFKLRVAILKVGCELLRGYPWESHGPHGIPPLP